LTPSEPIITRQPHPYPCCPIIRFMIVAQGVVLQSAPVLVLGWSVFVTHPAGLRVVGRLPSLFVWSPGNAPTASPLLLKTG
jgi:hypothetical protein